MPYTLHCRDCDWAVETPIELKGEANLRAGRHIAETGHSVKLRRIEPTDDFYRGGAAEEILTEPL